MKKADRKEHVARRVEGVGARPEVQEGLARARRVRRERGTRGLEPCQSALHVQPNDSSAAPIAEVQEQS